MYRKVNDIEFEEVDLTKIKPEEPSYEVDTSEYDDDDEPAEAADDYVGEDETAEEEEPVTAKNALHEIDDDKLPYLVSDLAQSANVNPTLERLRLEDIDISSAEGYPRLGNFRSFKCRTLM